VIGGGVRRGGMNATNSLIVRVRVLELFAGIGGCAQALSRDPDVEVVAAIDHDLRAAAVYRANHRHPVHVRNLVSVKAPFIAGFEADLWWMSPPCAPHTIRGAQSDLEDRRSEGFLRVVALLEALRPRWVALENVPWFAGSRSHALLTDTLDRLGYPRTEGEVCPTWLGIPGVRRRFYLVAGEGVRPWPKPVEARSPLSRIVDPYDATLAPDARISRFLDALHVVDADDDEAVAACFTSAYGRSAVYCGSWLRQDHEGERRLRRFSPTEIARLHGFPRDFAWTDISTGHAWRLAGNSLSVPVVRHILRAIPDLA
jgi:tRNA (cytosine38-C5)-methyltransferase